VRLPRQAEAGDTSHRHPVSGPRGCRALPRHFPRCSLGAFFRIASGCGKRLSRAVCGCGSRTSGFWGHLIQTPCEIYLTKSEFVSGVAGRALGAPCAPLVRTCPHGPRVGRRHGRQQLALQHRHDDAARECIGAICRPRTGDAARLDSLSCTACAACPRHFGAWAR
jgi:hypothetical protein